MTYHPGSIFWPKKRNVPKASISGRYLSGIFRSMRTPILPLIVLTTGTRNITRQRMWRGSLTYSIRWNEEALNDLKKIDRQAQKKIIAKVKDYLCKDPISIGKPLQGIFKGLYRYRYGSYRIIYAIDRGSVVVLILRVADRKDVYEGPINKN